VPSECLRPVPGQRLAFRQAGIRASRVNGLGSELAW
jgi:hypothetical protein